MDLPKRKHPRLKHYDYGQNGMYFLTICTKDREPLLGSVCVGDVLPEEERLGLEQMKLSPYGALCQRLLEEIPMHYTGVQLDCYVIMPDHLHVLLLLDSDACSGGQGSGRPTIPQIVHGFKRLTAVQTGRPLWQSSFYEHIIRTEQELAETRAYIQRNPIKQHWNPRHP